MALINHPHQFKIENAQGHLPPGKTYKASNLQQDFKKRTFSDVTNTVNIKSANHIGKNKPTPKDQTKGNFKFSIYNSESKNKVSQNQLQQKITNNVSDQIMEDEDDMNLSCCACSDVFEDDFAGDILFKNIKLSKKKIENLALNWENPPVPRIEDKRKIPVFEDPILNDGGICLRPLIDDEFDINIIDVPPVHFDCIDNYTDSGVEF